MNKFKLVSENETYLIDDLLKSASDKSVYILNTLRENQISVTMLRNMLFQKQIFGFYTMDHNKIEDLALFLNPSGFEKTNFIQLLFLTLTDGEFFNNIITNIEAVIDDNIQKIKVLIDNDDEQISFFKSLGFQYELSIDLGNTQRIHLSYFFEKGE